MYYHAHKNKRVYYLKGRRKPIASITLLLHRATNKRQLINGTRVLTQMKEFLI
jgi:hypothetical protein